MQWLRPVLLIFASLLLSMQANALPTRQMDNWQALDDAQGLLLLDDVRSTRLANAFKSVDSKRIRTAGGNSALWLRQQLTDARELQYLQVIAPFLSSLDLYVMQAGMLLEHSQTGSKLEQNQRPIPARDFFLTVPQSSQPLTLYLRLSSPYTLRPIITLAPASSMIANDARVVLLAGMLGALGMLVLYNLLRLSYLRNAPSLWLTISQAALLLGTMHLLGMLPDWLDFLRPLQGPHGNLIILLAMFSTVGYVRSLLHWPKPLPIAQRTLAGEMIAMAGCLPLLFLLNARQTTILVILVGCLALLTLLVVTSLHWQRGKQPARLLGIAMMIAVLSSTAGIGFFFNIPPFSMITQTDWLLAGILLASLLCSMALTSQQMLQLKDNIISSQARAASRGELKAKTEFLARINHDIRTPMNGVLGMAELLLATPLSNKQRDFVQTIRSSGNELLGLLGQILDVSRLESGMIELDMDQFDYAALVDDCLDIFRNQAAQQGVELINLIRHDVPPLLRSDPARIRQILLSLLENAFKHTPAGEVFLLSEVQHTARGPRLRVSIHDSGKTLEAAEQTELLNAELHGEDFISSNKLSGHLALIITRQLIRLMGGEFGFENTRNQGNTLWLALPLEKASNAATKILQEDDLQGIRVLVVDDNATCRKVLTEQCASWGMQVSTVASGHTALALLRTKANLDEDFDVVLLDQRMPNMSGTQLASRIKADNFLKNDTLILMLTDNRDAPSKLLARNAGINRILAKPVPGFTLRNALISALAKADLENL